MCVLSHCGSQVNKFYFQRVPKFIGRFSRSDQWINRFRNQLKINKKSGTGFNSGGGGHGGGGDCHPESRSQFSNFISSALALTIYTTKTFLNSSLSQQCGILYGSFASSIPFKFQLFAHLPGPLVLSGQASELYWVTTHINTHTDTHFGAACSVSWERVWILDTAATREEFLI